jgi:spoIIIJ-associated protein
MEEWVEVRAKTVDEAIAEGLRELGLDSQEAAEIEVLQEPQRGFLGIGAEPALVRMKAKPKRRRRHRSRSGGAEGTRGDGGRAEGRPVRGGQDRRGQGRSGGRDGGRPRQGENRRDGQQARSGQSRQGRPEGRAARPAEARRPSSTRSAAETPSASDVAEQAEVVRSFLEGLVEAFGLEGEVTTRVEGDIIYAEVTGDQTEALVGPKGAILDAVMELCRTMVHRHSQAGARLRLDIAGYAERRREALRIYAARLAEKVIAEGGEVMLEPMNPADRKVVHDAIADIDGVRSFSEGEEPERSVIIAPDDREDDE